MGHFTGMALGSFAADSTALPTRKCLPSIHGQSKHPMRLQCQMLAQSAWTAVGSLPAHLPAGCCPPILRRSRLRILCWQLPMWLPLMWLPQSMQSPQRRIGASKERLLAAMGLPPAHSSTTSHHVSPLQCRSLLWTSSVPRYTTWNVVFQVRRSLVTASWACLCPCQAVAPAGNKKQKISGIKLFTLPRSWQMPFVIHFLSVW